MQGGLSLCGGKLISMSTPEKLTKLLYFMQMRRSKVAIVKHNFRTVVLRKF